MNPRVKQPTVREVEQRVPPDLSDVFHVDAARSAFHFWIEAPAGDAWVVAYRLRVRDQRPLVVEMRIFPAEGPLGNYTAPPGEWSGSWIADGNVPGNGITSALLRKYVQPSISVQMLKELRHAGEQHALEYWAERGVTLKRTPSTRGRKPRPDDFFADIAQEYVTALERGSKSPAADLAKARGLNLATARSYVKIARERLLLDVAPNGIAGGSLTEKAKRLLTGPKRGKRK